MSVKWAGFDMAGPARSRRDTGAITLFKRRVADEGKSAAGVNSGRVGAFGPDLLSTSSAPDGHPLSFC